MDRMAQLNEALKTGAANGWERLPGSRDTIRRITEHVTPDYAVKNGWWTHATYPAVEFLSFVFSSRTRVPKVVHGVGLTTWTGRNDRTISFKRSLELIAQPLSESPIHNRD